MTLTSRKVDIVNQVSATSNVPHTKVAEELGIYTSAINMVTSNADTILSL